MCVGLHGSLNTSNTRGLVIQSHPSSSAVISNAVIVLFMRDYILWGTRGGAALLDEAWHRSELEFAHLYRYLWLWQFGWLWCWVHVLFEDYWDGLLRWGDHFTPEYHWTEKCCFLRPSWGRSFLSDLLRLAWVLGRLLLSCLVLSCVRA